MLKKILLVLLIIVIFIQFIRPAKNAAELPSTTAIDKMYTVPAEVAHILEKACYDCHSNTTRYPWYSHIQPVDWWLTRHINGGKGQLDFSEFGSYSFGKQAKKLRKAASEVKDGGMPLNSYTWIHKDAILTADEKNTLISWASMLSQKIATEHNVDMNAKEKR